MSIRIHPTGSIYLPLFCIGRITTLQKVISSIPTINYLMVFFNYHVTRSLWSTCSNHDVLQKIFCWWFVTLNWDYIAFFSLFLVVCSRWHNNPSIKEYNVILFASMEPGLTLRYCFSEHSDFAGPSLLLLICVLFVCRGWDQQVEDRRGWSQRRPA